jgi:hypothetical protein
VILACLLVSVVALSHWPTVVAAQSDDDSLISIEAESFSARGSVGGQEWKTYSVTGATGDRALQAVPNNGTNIDLTFVADSPRLDYAVDFAESGNYFVWIRGRGASIRDDSLHVGLNGVEQSRADRVTGFEDRWTWSSATMDGKRALIRVSSAGRQTLNIWMREDGMVVDKIVLSKDSSFRPTDFGSDGPAVTPTGETAPPPSGGSSGSDSGSSGSDSDGSGSDSGSSGSDSGSSGSDSGSSGSDSGSTGSDGGSSGSDSGSSVPDNVVSIETEQYASNVGVGGHDWAPALVSGASAGGSLQPLPNDNTNRDTGFVVNSPRLDYDVNFPTSGKYYIWVRGRGATSNDDSLHIGLNGQADSRADRITGFKTGWTWTSDTMDDVRASINVESAGRQQLTLWMREDGTIVDKVFLTTNASLKPTDFGPLGPPSTETVSPPPATPDSSSAVLALEAEQFVSNVGVGGHSWSAVSVSGSSGGNALQALPNTGQNTNSDYVTRSPRLDYAVDFPASGTYYVWIRGRADTSKDNSLHVGLNGSAEARADRITGFDDSWRWSNDTMDNQPATIVVANAGRQVLNVWMREDGMVIDKIMLTMDATANPTDFGSLGPRVTEPVPPGGDADPPASSQNTPPVISGSPPSSVVAGSTYSFTPTLRDADGDSLTTSISGLPDWASFRSSDGRIRGIPGPADVGQYRNIVITVSDGTDTDSLGPVTIDVTASASGSVTLTWEPPTRNTDGSALTNLAGYELRWGPEGGSLDQSVSLSNGGLSRYVVDGIAPGIYEFVILAVNSKGVYSSPSNPARVTIQ